MGFSFWFLLLFGAFLFVVFIAVVYTIVQRDRKILRQKKQQQST